MPKNNGHSRMELILQEFARLEKEKRTPGNEESDPQVTQLIKEGDAMLRQLDPIVRETFRDHPKELAEWDSIMQQYYALDEEEPDKSD